MVDQILTLKEVAAYLKLAEKTAYRLASEGKLPGFKVDGSWRFKREDIDKLLMDEYSIFTLTEKEQEKRAAQLEIDLMGYLRGSGNPKFVALDARQEKLRQDYETGVIKAIDWLQGLFTKAYGYIEEYC